MSYTKSAVEEARRYLEERPGSEASQIVNHLNQKGFPRMQIMGALRGVLGLSVRDAKQAVMSHSVFKEGMRQLNVSLELATEANFNTVFNAYDWKAVPENPGCYVISGAGSRMSPGELIDDQYPVKELYARDSQDAMWVTALPDGGLLSYPKADGSFLHMLGNFDGFKRATEELSLPQQDVVHMSISAWATVHAGTEFDLDPDLEEAGLEHLRSLDAEEATIMRPRAVGILLNDHHEVLLILRRKAGREYATLPGGGIEAGETPEMACAREFLEEVNLIVEVGPPVFRLQARGDDDHYFQVSYRSGEMRLGDGPDAPPHSEANHYDPQWVSVERLEDVNFVPPEVRAVVRGLASGDGHTPPLLRRSTTHPQPLSAPQPSESRKGRGE